MAQDEREVVTVRVPIATANYITLIANDAGVTPDDAAAVIFALAMRASYPKGFNGLRDQPAKSVGKRKAAKR